MRWSTIALVRSGAPPHSPSSPTRRSSDLNYGPRIGEAKGLVGPVLLGGTPLTDWQATPLPIEDWAQRLRAGEPPAAARPRGGAPAAAGLPGPALVVWDVPRSEPADLFLDTVGWGKGLAWFNGWNLGRYWGKGPQQTLYVPAPVTGTGTDRLVALELLATTDAAARFVPGPRWATTTAD